LKVLVRGPGLTRTGYGEHCRFVLRSLREMQDIDLYFIPLGWGKSNWMWEDDEERQWMDSVIFKTVTYMQQGGQIDISIQVTIPNEWERIAPVNIGVTAGIETTRVSPVWLQKSNIMDKIITISEHSKRGFVETVYNAVNQETGQETELGCHKSVDIVHYPVKEFEPVDLDLDITTKFNFLTVAQWGPRKNIESTIKWFVEEFIDNPDVGLVVKTFLMGGCVRDRLMIEKEFEVFLSSYENRKCKVYLLHGSLTDQEMDALYNHDSIHALLSLTHGEGFGLPLFEAAYSGLPVMATDWGGQLDFLYKDTVDKKGKTRKKAHYGKIDYVLQPVPQSAYWEGVIEKDVMWAYPQQGSCKMKLREIYKDYGRFKSQARKLQEWIKKEFAEDKQYGKMRAVVEDFLPDEQQLEWSRELNEIEIL